MNVDALSAAITAAEDLAEEIGNARYACMNAVPYRGPVLTSLADATSVMATAPPWLRAGRPLAVADWPPGVETSDIVSTVGSGGYGYASSVATATNTGASQLQAQFGGAG